jgi:hypothetical protein
VIIRSILFHTTKLGNNLELYFYVNLGTSKEESGGAQAEGMEVDESEDYSEAMNDPAFLQVS